MTFLVAPKKPRDNRTYLYRFPQLLLVALLQMRNTGRIEALVTTIDNLANRDTPELDERGHSSVEVQNELISAMLSESCVIL